MQQTRNLEITKQASGGKGHVLKNNNTQIYNRAVIGVELIIVYSVYRLPEGFG